MTRPSPLTRIMAEPDAVAVAIRKAVASVKAAERTAREDMRTNGTACCDYLALALENSGNSTAWMKSYLAEVAADERRVAAPAKPKPQEEPHGCHICGDPIEPGDLTICSGCDGPTCPTCMEGETCVKCFAEPE